MRCGPNYSSIFACMYSFFSHGGDGGCRAVCTHASDYSAFPLLQVQITFLYCTVIVVYSGLMHGMCCCRVCHANVLIVFWAVLVIERGPVANTSVYSDRTWSLCLIIVSITIII